MDEEIWKPVNGYEGAYEVSSLGRVRSLPRTILRGRSPLRISGRFLKPCVNGKGYHVFTLSMEGKTRTIDAHRLVAEAFLGPIPEGQYTRHLNGDRTDCRVSNLAYGTPVQNQADRLIHGTDGRGEKNSQSKLCGKIVIKIRSMANMGVSKTDIAQAFGISARQVRAIAGKRAWRHI